MTTVIITDFYKKSSTNKGGSSNSKEQPTEIRNVRLSLPGLEIKLNGTDVILLSKKEEEDPHPVLKISNSEMTNTSILTSTLPAPMMLLSSDMIPSWKSVLHGVGNVILEGMPFVQRVY